MHIRHLIVAAISLLAVATATSSLGAQTQPKAALNITGSTWPPYIDKSRPNFGVAADIVATAFKRAGYELNGKFESWPRTLEGTSIGVYDVIAAAWYTEERAKTLAFSEPYMFNDILLVKRKDDDIKFNGFADLRGLVIGVVDGYAYDEAFDQAPNLLRVPANHVIQNLLMLTQGKVDLTIGDKWAIRHELAQYLPTAAAQLEFLPKPVARRGLHIAVSRANPQHEKIVADFNKALAAMKADGSWQAIIDRHAKDLAQLAEQPL
ncbi:MAG: hypothetical protein AMJ69_12310 [Gammaproteobacteria bacterium SG8_47]|nr:MAG: hypothetical protein AMJ69_12310 [Gammaproteobacteria bacterium SG8_47]